MKIKVRQAVPPVDSSPQFEPSSYEIHPLTHNPKPEELFSEGAAGKQFVL